MSIVFLAALSILLALGGIVSGFRQPPASEFGATVMIPVALPYALAIAWTLTGKTARAAILAFGTAAVAFLALILFAAVFTLFLGFAMGNRDQINFALLLDAFVATQLPLAVVAWRALRRAPPHERTRGAWLLGFGLPAAIAVGIVAIFTGMESGIAQRRETVYQNEHAAREAMTAVAACLNGHAQREGGFPADLRALGEAGSRCLDARLAAGELPSHRLIYSPALPAADGRIRAYGLCAEARNFGRTAWRTYVADESGRVAQFEPREGMTQAASCGEAWDGRLMERLRYCAIDHAARHPDRGYPATLDALRSHPGTGCLAPSLLGAPRVAGDRVTLGEIQASYRAGARDGGGRVAAFEIFGEELLAGRWRVNLLLDDSGAWHAAEDRAPTRDDPAPEALRALLETRAAEREAARAIEKRRCEQGDAARCRALGGENYRERRDTAAFEFWRIGCGHGDGVACLLGLRESDFRLFSLAYGLFEACRNEEAGACEKLERLGRDHPRCQAGDHAACSSIAIRLGQHADTFAANELWKKGCRAGHRESCYLLDVRDFEYKGALQLKDMCETGRRDACREFERRMEAFLTPR